MDDHSGKISRFSTLYRAVSDGFSLLLYKQSFLQREADPTTLDFCVSDVKLFVNVALRTIKAKISCREYNSDIVCLLTLTDQLLVESVVFLDWVKFVN